MVYEKMLRNPRKVWPRKMDRAACSKDVTDAIADNLLVLVVYQYSACPLCGDVADLVNPELARRPDLHAVWADPAAIACEGVPEVLPAAHLYVAGERVAEMVGLTEMAATLPLGVGPKPVRTPLESFFEAERS